MNNKPTLHIINQPHTQTTVAYSRCAYTMKAYHLVEMLRPYYKIILYAGEETDTNSDVELKTCITKNELSKLGFNSPDDYLKNDFDSSKPLWKIFHQRVIYYMNQSVKKGDFILTFSGACDKEIKDAFPQCYFIESGIGYSGILLDGFHIYESYGWMHSVWASMYANGNASTLDGRFYDVVINGYYDPKDFPFSEENDGYVVFLARMIYRKGLKIVEEVSKRMPETKFILAGQGAKVEGNKIIGVDVTIENSGNIEYVGTVNPEQRGKLLSRAKALICPTQYVPPFENTHIEAMACGVPVISTDFGVFAETIIDDITGYRCHTIKEFVEGIKNSDKLNRKQIRDYALSKWSMPIIALQYKKYFERISGLENGGFYEY